MKYNGCIFFLILLLLYSSVCTLVVRERKKHTMTQETNGLIPLTVLESVALFAVTLSLVRYYAVKHTSYVYLSAVGIAWYFGFFGTLFIAIDLAMSYAKTPAGSSER